MILKESIRDFLFYFFFKQPITLTPNTTGQHISYAFARTLFQILLYSEWRLTSAWQDMSNIYFTMDVGGFVDASVVNS